jgi:subtilisin
MTKKRKSTVLLLILILIISTLFSGMTFTSNSANGMEKVDVLIAFHQPPGPSEEALVRGFGGSVKFTYDIVPAIAASLPQSALEGLSKNPKVALIEPDVAVYALGDTYPWGVKQVAADLVHKNENTGAGVKVAVIDSGIDFNHPELAAQYAGGKNFINTRKTPMDDNGHGTHVAGTIAAAMNNTNIIGVAPNVSLYGLKVLDASGNGSFSSIIAALDWCVKEGIQVTNNSYGSSVDPGTTVQSAFDAAYDHGVLHIASAGNSGTSDGQGETVGYPANYSSVVAVAATDNQNLRGYFSSTGQNVEISAPGVSIYSTYPGSKYATMSGTSMASPHVAGVAALVISSGVTSPVAVRERLTSTAADLGVAGRDPWYGFGLVDASKAVISTVTPPELPESPQVVITSPTACTVSGQVTIVATVTSKTSISKVEFFVDATLIGTDQNAADGWSIPWDSTKITNGSHTIQVKATDSYSQEGTASLDVNVQNSADQTVSVKTLGGISKWVNKVTWNATVTGTLNYELDGAVITGTWSNGTTGTAVSAGGTFILTSSNLNKKTSSIIFKVTDISAPGATFKSGEFDSITVSIPK